MKQGSEVIERTEKNDSKDTFEKDSQKIKTFADPTMTNTSIKLSLKYMKRLKVNG